MADRIREDRRSRLGYGSSYRKGSGPETGVPHEIPSVLGGQVWLVKPDKEAKAAHPCLWMQAGVAKFKNCTNYYDCTTCTYDAAMARKAAEGKQLTWQAAMKRKPDRARVCRHSLTQRIDSRLCAYDYECAKCDFDQFFEDVWTPKSTSFPDDIQRIRGFDVPMGYYFHNGHAWARIESGGCIRIGLDDFSLKLLGKADKLELPLMGKELDHNKAGWGLQRNNNHADVLSPVDGVIVEVNSKVRENPEVSNRDPYSEGWLFMVRTPDVKAAMNNLMVDEGSISWMNAEAQQLEQMIEEVAGPLAADGGYLADDIYGNMPQLGWSNLTQRFLKT